MGEMIHLLLLFLRLYVTFPPCRADIKRVINLVADDVAQLVRKARPGVTSVMDSATSACRLGSPGHLGMFSGVTVVADHFCHPHKYAPHPSTYPPALPTTTPSTP